MEVSKELILLKQSSWLEHSQQAFVFCSVSISELNVYLLEKTYS